MTRQPDDSEQTLLSVPVTRYRPVVECIDCGAELTDSMSRRWGRGPSCRRGINGARRPGAFAVDQERLPDL